MKLLTLRPAEAVGHILCHNYTNLAGHKVLVKGNQLLPTDLLILQQLDVHQVPVAVLDPDDVHENVAAQRLAQAMCGDALRVGPPVAGRANLHATRAGVVHINVEALFQINSIDGFAIGTLFQHTVAQARKRVATVKIIPFAVSEALLVAAEAIAKLHNRIVHLRPLEQRAVGVVLVGSTAAQARIQETVYPAVAGRITDAGSTVLTVRWTPPEAASIAQALVELQQLGAELVIVAGETSVTDRNDVTPQGVELAGGHVEHYGAPVEPGNLLMLGYIGDAVPVIGAPGCIRSRSRNIVDTILPRLLSGEQLTKRDIVMLGHGGLLV